MVEDEFGSFVSGGTLIFTAPGRYQVRYWDGGEGERYFFLVVGGEVPEIAPAPTPEPAPQPTPEPIQQPTPEPAPQPTPEPVPTPAPAPVPVVVPPVVISPAGDGFVEGVRTPFADINTAWFPVGSIQTVDYANALNVRRGPGVNHAAFNHVLRGDTITVLEFRNGWVQIDTEFGNGWVSAMYLRRP